MGSKSSKVLYWLPAILYMGLIFFLSSRPAPPELQPIPIIMHIKLVHLVEYGILSLLIWYALFKTTSLPPLWLFTYAIALTVLYGLTDELHQCFVQGRTAGMADAIANGVGAGLMQGIVYLKTRRKS